MAEAEPTTAEQIAEYESQLAGIVELLEASPGDESLLALKRDLEELLELSRAGSTGAGGGAPPDPELPLPPPPLPPPPPPAPGPSTASAAGEAAPTVAAAAEPASAAGKERPHKAKKSGSKKPKKVRDFVLPDHLVPNDTDTEAERNKKRRAAKSLKNKWRLQKKEIESNNRQKSWQSFQKKGHVSTGSIFATKEGINDRVGVVSKKKLTDFGARKRHK
ncbi:unnamed protein product [Pseudo-nitzschia multistriata]|uniref:Uncharacterized protein n=1 Tax=Pseudo-nitzschia multistriata TaxID=183589 RepID=A0A448Z2U7_9STRA|nr:unnamed protein product [Pseudo-nitzschia multistriata]